MSSSRYVRRTAPADNVVLTVRDTDILARVHDHRFMLAEHLHPLFFPGRTLRTVQSRLAKLWQHGYLDRLFIPYVLDGTRRAPAEAATPVYALGDLGIETLKKTAGDPSLVGGAVRDRGFSPMTLAHHLVVTDFLASCEAAALSKGVPESIVTEHEWQLWKRAADRKASTHGLAVPDGAVTFRSSDRPVPETWYLEIVRADVSGGNRNLLAKMRQYLALRTEGRFQQAFGHSRVRGVLIATPTPQRAENLRALAASLPKGPRFFAFTHFEERQDDRRVRRFRPDTVMELAWTDGSGGVVRLGHADHEAPVPLPRQR